MALKLAEAEVIRQITGDRPIALLDDVMSELDQKRQNYILNHINGWQVFVTCCDPLPIKQQTEGKIFLVKNGRVEEG